MWMNGPVDAVEASNAPGQRTHEEAGRRVRVVDAIRQGDGLRSNFASVRESRSGEGDFPVRTVTRVTSESMPGAVALKIETASGVYYALNNAEEVLDIDGLQFQGTFALVLRKPDGTAQVLALGAALLSVDGVTVTTGSPTWSAAATRASASALEAAVAPPSDWNFSPGTARAYARVNLAGEWSGFRIDSVEGTLVKTLRFPMQAIEGVEIPAIVYWTSER
jgi:hypothetical protein